MDNSRFKFRVWDKETNKYYKSKISNSSGSVIYQHPSSNSCSWVGINTLFADLEKDEENNKQTKAELDFIIEQCTGLKDKNGNLIYEHDYVMINKIIYKVFWNKTKISLANILNDDIIDFIETEEMEIIGNEHEETNIRKI